MSQTTTTQEPTMKTYTVDGVTYRPALPLEDAERFFVVAQPEPHDPYRVAAESKTFRNAAKRASELQAKRYNWGFAQAMVEVAA